MESHYIGKIKGIIHSLLSILHFLPMHASNK